MSASEQLSDEYEDEELRAAESTEQHITLPSESIRSEVQSQIQSEARSAVTSSRSTKQSEEWSKAHTSIDSSIHSESKIFFLFAV